jgi:hypothetical protein
MFAIIQFGILGLPISSKNLKIKIHRTTILPVVTYGCETWSLTLRKEQRSRMFENRVVRGIFGPKRDEVVGGWLENLKGRPLGRYKCRWENNILMDLWEIEWEYVDWIHLPQNRDQWPL